MKRFEDLIFEPFGIPDNLPSIIAEEFIDCYYSSIILSNGTILKVFKGKVFRSNGDTTFDVQVSDKNGEEFPELEGLTSNLTSEGVTLLMYYLQSNTPYSYPVNENNTNRKRKDKIQLKGQYDFSELKIMPYDIFLQSNYWKEVAKAVKREAGYKCEICGDTKRLEVHHTTYEHKGEEYLYPEDLQCLCHKCHSEVHKKEESDEIR